MAVKIREYVVQITANSERNYDAQADRFNKIPELIGWELEQGWWGEPDTWVIHVSGNANLITTSRKIEKAILKARKVRSKDENQRSDCSQQATARHFNHLKNNPPKMTVTFTTVD